MQHRVLISVFALSLCSLSGVPTESQESENSKVEKWRSLADEKRRFEVLAPATWKGVCFAHKDKSGVDFIAPEKGPLAHAKFQVYAYDDPGICSKLTVRYWIGMFTKQLEKGGLRPYRSAEDISVYNSKTLMLFYRQRLKKEVKGEVREFEVLYWFVPVKIDAERFVVMNLGAEKRFLEGNEKLARRLFTSVRFENSDSRGVNPAGNDK